MNKLPAIEDAATSRRLCIIGEADLFISRLLRRFAEKYGLRTLCVQTGEEVLAQLALSQERQERPAVIVLEPELPGRVRGWEAARAIRRGSPIAGRTTIIPIILCAWLGETEAQALVGQASPCLQKPDLHYEDFVAALEMVSVVPD